MIWYRHWLELRYRLLGAAVIALLIHLFFPLSVHGGMSWFQETGRLASEISDAQALLATMGPERLIAWGVHVQFSIVSATLAALMLAGSSFRQVNGWGVIKGIDTYSATLPVSLFDLDATRLAAGFAGVSAIAFGTCLLDFAALLIAGNPVPWLPMLRASLAGTVLLLPLLAILALASMNLWSLVLVAYPAPLVVVTWGWPALRSVMFDPDVASFAAMLALPATVILFMMASWLRRWKEF